MAEIDDLKRDLEFYGKENKLNSEKIEFLFQKIEKKLADDKNDSKSGFGRYFTPLTGPIYVALVTGLLAFGSSVYQKWNESKIESRKSQQQIVMKSFESKDLEQTKANLLFFAKTGLIPDASNSIIQAIKDGSINNIKNPFKIISPKSGDTLNGSKVFEIFGTYGYLDSGSNLVVLIRDATVSLPSTIYYPTTGHVTLTTSANGKWFLPTSVGLKGHLIICIGKANSVIIDTLVNKANRNDLLGIPINDDSFQVLDFVTVYVK